MRLTKKIIAMCFAVGMTLMPMGQAFANEEGETIVETTTWYYIDHGVLNWKYTGLTYYVDCWYYVENGILTWKYTGVTKYYGTWYYVQNSAINWKYSGTFTQNGHLYQISYGIVVG